MLYKNYQKTILLFNVLLSGTSLSLYASLPEEELSRSSSCSSSSSINISPTRKRSAEHLSRLLTSPVKKQTFARATYDSTAKYLLSNDQVRLDFVQTFSGLTNIASTQQLGSALNPLQELTGLRVSTVGNCVKAKGGMN